MSDRKKSPELNAAIEAIIDRLFVDPAEVERQAWEEFRVANYADLHFMNQDLQALLEETEAKQGQEDIGVFSWTERDESEYPAWFEEMYALSIKADRLRIRLGVLQKVREHRLVYGSVTVPKLEGGDATLMRRKELARRLIQQASLRGEPYQQSYTLFEDMAEAEGLEGGPDSIWAYFRRKLGDAMPSKGSWDQWESYFLGTLQNKE